MPKFWAKLWCLGIVILSEGGEKSSCQLTSRCGSPESRSGDSSQLKIAGEEIAIVASRK